MLLGRAWAKQPPCDCRRGPLAVTRARVISISLHVSGCDVHQLLRVRAISNSLHGSMQTFAKPCPGEPGHKRARRNTKI
eukprot:2320784-Lingulodinium_polyedra.AAC.1